MNSSLGTALRCIGACAGTYFVAKEISKRMNAFDFRGRVALINGGSRGLGLELARRLVEEGSRVAILARDEDELDAAEIDLIGRGNEGMACVCDVTKPEQVHEAIADVRNRLGPVDVLVNNAGVIQVGPVETMLLEDYEESMATHFWGPLYAIQGVLTDMIRRGGGRIVNISSIGGKMAVPHLGPYCAGKFALVGLSQGLRVELAKNGVYVTTVCPGMMRTGSPRHAWFKGKHREEYAWFSIADSIPILSANVERAARQIVDACRYGQSELVLSLPAKLAVRADALAPDLTSGLLSLAGRFLPSANGIGAAKLKGKDSQSQWSPSWATALTEKAARRQNQMTGE